MIIVATVAIVENSQIMMIILRKAIMAGEIHIIITPLLRIQTGAMKNHLISSHIPTIKWDGMMVIISGKTRQT